MEVTVTELLAKIGALTVENDALRARLAQHEVEKPDETPEPAE